MRSVTTLDDTVVEDGEQTEVVKPDRPALPTKSKDLLINGMLGMGKRDNKLNNLIVGAPNKREPVEVDDDHRGQEGDDGSDEKSEEEVERLTSTLKGCSIQETGSCDIEAKFSQLAVKDKKDEESDDEENDETRCASFQSQSSTITVDPPSLTHERDEEEENEDENEGSAAEQDLLDRGPMAGKPVNFHPSSDINRIASKMNHGVHNLDRFHKQVAPIVPQQEINRFGQSTYTQGAYPQQQDMYYQQTNTGVNIGYSQPVVCGKRAMDDDDANPFKYTRPVDEGGYLNNLSDGRKMPPSFSQISQHHMTGGQMVDSSPDILSPTSELIGPNFTTQFSASDMDSLLEMLGEHDPRAIVQQEPQYQQLQQNIRQPDFPQMSHTNMDKAPASVASRHMRDYDPGYASENSPHSENAGSPGSSPKSTFSPMRPPSNMSGDSGIASPYDGDSTAHSPSHDHSQSCSQVGITEDYLNSPASYMTSPASMMNTSSPSGQIDDYSMASVQSPDGGSDPFIARLPEFKDALEVIANDMRQETMRKPTSVPTTPSQKITNICPQQQRNGYPQCIPQAQARSYSSQPVAAQMIQSPGGQPSLSRTMGRQAMSPSAGHPSLSTAGKGQQSVSNMPPPMSSTPSPPTHHNIPIPVMTCQQQKPSNDFPVKLPLPPLTKQSNFQQQPVVTNSVPLLAVTLGSNQVTSTNTTTTSQPLLVMSQPTGPPLIFVIPQNQPVQQQTPKPKEPRKLRTILPSAPTSSQPASATRVPSPPKAESAPRVASPKTGQNGMLPPPAAPALITGQQQQPHVSPPASPNNKNNNRAGRNPQQAKMLNVARRLVASMTREDLEFQDADGDTYLHVSVCKADHNMVQALLERLDREQLRDMVNTENCMRQTPLYLAVSSNSPEMVALLIEYDADVNRCAQYMMADGRTTETTSALHCIASKGVAYLRTLQALLTSRYIIIDSVNSDGHTALHCAILEHGKSTGDGTVIDNVAIIQTLVRSGADPNAQGKKNGKTPLMYAVESRDFAVIESLVALMDLQQLDCGLRRRAFDETTCQKIVENVQRSMDEASRQRLQNCLKLRGRRDC